MTPESRKRIQAAVADVMSDIGSVLAEHRLANPDVAVEFAGVIVVALTHDTATDDDAAALPCALSLLSGPGGDPSRAQLLLEVAHETLGDKLRGSPGFDNRLSLVGTTSVKKADA